MVRGPESELDWERRSEVRAVGGEDRTSSEGVSPESERGMRSPREDEVKTRRPGWTKSGVGSELEEVRTKS